MATKRVKNEDERLDDVHMDHVIQMLESPVEGTKAWNKKECCAYLGITYNTTRLGTLIEKYKERKAADAARRAEKRGKPATDGEISYVITSYLEGATVDAISTALYRSSGFVKGIVENYGVPVRQTGHSYFKPELVPEAAIKEKFLVGEKVYSMRYDSLGIVKREFKPGIYSVYLTSDKQQQFCYQPWWELASLDHLKKYANI